MMKKNRIKKYYAGTQQVNYGERNSLLALDVSANVSKIGESIPGKWGKMVLAVGATAGLFTSVVGNKGTVDLNTGQMTPGRGIIGSVNKSRLIRDAGKVLNNIAFALNSQLFAKLWYDNNGYNEPISAANGGFIPRTLAYLDDGEYGQTPDGEEFKIPELGKPKDSNLVNVPVGTSIISNVNGPKGSKDSYAKIYEKNKAKTNMKGNDIYALNSKMLNEIFNRDLHNVIVAVQEGSKKGKNKPGKYDTGTPYISAGGRKKVPIQYIYNKDLAKFGYYDPNTGGFIDMDLVPNDRLPDSTYTTRPFHYNKKRLLIFDEKPYTGTDVYEDPNVKKLVTLEKTTTKSSSSPVKTKFIEKPIYPKGFNMVTRPAAEEPFQLQRPEWYDESGRPFPKAKDMSYHPGEMKQGWLWDLYMKNLPQGVLTRYKDTPSTNLIISEDFMDYMDYHSDAPTSRKKNPYLPEEVVQLLKEANSQSGNWKLEYVTPWLDGYKPEPKSASVANTEAIESGEKIEQPAHESTAETVVKTIGKVMNTGAEMSQKMAGPKGAGALKGLTKGGGKDGAKTADVAKTVDKAVDKAAVETKKGPGFLKDKTASEKIWEATNKAMNLKKKPSKKRDFSWIGDALNNAVSLAGPLSNMFASRGTPNRAYMYTPSFAPAEVNISDRLRDINTTYANSLYNANMMYPSTGAGMSIGLQAAVNRDKQIADAYGYKTNAQNNIAMHNAGIANQARQFNANAMHTAAVEEAQDVAALNQIHKQGLSDLSTAYQTANRDKRLTERDMLIARAGLPFFNYGMSNDFMNEYRKYFKG